MAEKNVRELQPDTVVKDRYIIRELIAKGGMASTYLAEDRQTNKQVVLKVLSFSELENWKIYDLFKREISTLKNLDHPQIPDYIDHFDATLQGDTCSILVQEYAGGSTLFDLVMNGKKFTFTEIREMLISLLKILSNIHQLNPPVIHRDINPKNIILDAAGNVYLVDFSASGSLKKTTIAAARSDTFVGTIGYIPPEQFYGKAMPQSDIYALGVTMIFLATGREPSGFDLTGLKLDYKPYASLPEDLERLLDMMIDPDSAKRPESADQALEILNRWSGEKTDEKKDNQVIKIPPPPRRVPFQTRSLIKFNDLQEVLGLGLFLLFVLPVIFIPVMHVRRVIPSLLLFFADSTANGVITDYEYTGDSTWDDTSILKYYFRFTTEDTTQYEQFSFVTGKIYENRERVTVRYLRSNPHFSVIRGERYSPFYMESLTVLAVLIMFIVFPFPAFIMAMGNKPGAGRYIRLLKKGTVIYGEIVHAKQRSGKYHVYYSFIDKKNRERKGKQKIDDPDWTRTCGIIPVLYLNGPFRTYSRIFDKPVIYNHGKWALDFELTRVFNDKIAMVFAVIRPALLLGFLIMTILDMIFGV